MAVIRFYELDAARGGSIDEDFKREYTRHFMAICTKPDDREPQIFQHPKCPRPRETRSDCDNLARCVSVSASYRKHTRYFWDVEARYSSVEVDQKPSDNPLSDPAEVEISTTLSREERFFDRRGNPFLNTAGDLYQKVIDVPRAVIEITKNIALYDAWIGDVAGIVNSAPVRINAKMYEPETLKVTSARIGKVQSRNRIEFMVAALQLTHKSETWRERDLNLGWNELVPKIVDGKQEMKKGKLVMKKVRVKEGPYGTDGGTGEPVTTRVFLDSKGMRPREDWTHPQSKRITENGIAKAVLDPRDIVVLETDVLALYDFNRLPLR